MPNQLAHHALARIAFLAAPALLLAGHAAASPIVVLNDGIHENLIISRGEYRIHIFQDNLEIDPWPTPGGDAPNSLILNFQFEFGDPTRVTGVIAGNMLPDFPPLPLQSPSLMVDGGLRLEGSDIDATRSFISPSYDDETGDSRPAFIAHGTGAFDSFNLYTFSDGDTAYVGFSDADEFVYGYMQIERVNVLDWKLIGYAYDPSGGGILVQNLVPAPGGVAVLALAAAPLLTRTRRRRENAR
jgi:hypothetical protein